MVDHFEEIRKARRKNIKRTKCRFNDDANDYPVYDLSVKGFSFLCDKKKCFFDKNLKLNNIVFQDAEGKRLIEASGAIVYAKAFDHANMKVGVSFIKNKIIHSVVGQIRAPRYFPSIKMVATVAFSNREPVKTYQGFIIDYTPSSTRVAFPDSLPHGAELGDAVHLTIASGGTPLLDDTANIIRKKSDNTELIFQFSNQFLDVPYIETISEAMKDQEDITTLLKEMDDYQQVSSEFKALVSDWRMYLSRLKQFLDKEDIKRAYREKDEQIFFLKGIEDTIIRDMGNYITQLNAITDRLEKPESLFYKKYFRENMVPFLRMSPFVASVIDKDRGYAGNYEIIKQLFEAPYRGDTLFAKLINRLSLSMDAVTAHQDRIDFLYNTLESMYHTHQGPFSFFVLGSGPGEEILRFIGKNPFPDHKKVRATLLDMDAFALVDFKDQIQYLDSKNCELHPLNRNLLNIIAGRDEDPVTDTYALTYCAGMFDYFSQKICRRIIDYMLKHTQPGGMVIATNVHKNCYARAFMDYGGEWELVLRDEAEMAEMVPAGLSYELTSDDKHANIYLKIHVPKE